MILATDAGKAAIIAAPADATEALFIQKVTISVTTLGAQAHTFQDNASTPIKVGTLEASVAVGVTRTWDFGARGFKLTAGKQLDISGSAAPAYSWSIDAYQQPVSVKQASTIDRTV